MRFAQFFVVACSIFISMNASGQDFPPFLEQLIGEYEAVSESGPLIEVWQYEYMDEPVFYIPLSRIICCDIMSVLYNADGEMICRPDGGFTGRGDGRCPDFPELRVGGVRVWGNSAYEHARNDQQMSPAEHTE